MSLSFVVEQAGCASCAEVIRETLAAVGTVVAVDVDEASDSATVRLHPAHDVSVGALDSLLRDASVGSGHAYRVKPGSLVAAT